MDGLYIALIVVNFALIALPPALERRRRRAARRGLTAIGAVKQGEKVRIMGSAVARGPLRTSPVLQRRCIGYRVVVECDEYGGFPRVHTVIEQEEFDSFVLADGTGQALLHGPFAIELKPVNHNQGGRNDLPPAVLDLLEERGVRAPVRGDPRTFTYVETVLMPGDAIIAGGYATIEVDPGGRSSHRDPPVICHLKGTDDARVVITRAG